MYGEDGVLSMDSKTTTTRKIDPKSQKFAENWLPIKAIQNGEIILDNGFRVTGVKVRPRNIFILDYDSQANAIFNLRNFYNTIDYELQILTAEINLSLLPRLEYRLYGEISHLF